MLLVIDTGLLSHHLLPIMDGGLLDNNHCSAAGLSRREGTLDAVEDLRVLGAAAQLGVAFECDDAKREKREHARRLVVARECAALVDAEALVDALAAHFWTLAENGEVEADAAPADETSIVALVPSGCD